MGKYVIRKMLAIIPIMLIVSVATFYFTSMASGDPAQIILSASGVKVTDEALALKRAELGLDQPLYIQYLGWLNGILHFDLGTDYISGLPVADDLVFRFLGSLRLALLSIILLILMTVPLGVASAVHKGNGIDRVSRAVAFVSAACPAFCVGLLLIYIFGVKLGIVSVIETEHGLGILLPAVTIAFSHAGSYIRLVHTSMDEVLEKDYIKAARAKGLTSGRVLFKHAFKNAMLPLVTKFGITIGGFIGGSTIVEIVFSYRGLGTYIMGAISSQDYPVIAAYVIFMAAILAVLNLLVDIVYVATDPRIKLA